MTRHISKIEGIAIIKD